MKKVLITGGNGDLAKAIKERLLSAGGYQVENPGKEELNVTDVDSVKRYIEELSPDILINNAGAVNDRSIRDTDIERDRRVIDIDLFGVFNCTAAALRAKPDAKIIVVGSSAANKIHGDWSSYCAAKAGVVMATKCWAADGVDAVCLSPGRARTKMRKGLFPDEDQSKLLSPEDYAEVVYMAVMGKYAPGTHLFVTVNNVSRIISGEITTDNENK